MLLSSGVLLSIRLQKIEEKYKAPQEPGTSEAR